MIPGLSVLHSHKPQSYAAQCPRSYSYYPPLILILTSSFLPHSILSSLLPSKILFFLLFHSPFPTLTLYLYFEAKYHYICQGGPKYSNLLLLPQLHKRWDGRCVVCTCFIFFLSFYLMI